MSTRLYTGGISHLCLGISLALRGFYFFAVLMFLHRSMVGIYMALTLLSRFQDVVLPEKLDNLLNCLGLDVVRVGAVGGRYNAAERIATVQRDNR